VKLLFKKKQAQREGNFISRLNICLEIWNGKERFGFSF
jgi:hypothetical protein